MLFTHILNTKDQKKSFFQPETRLTVLSAILGTTQDVTTPGTGHTQRFALGDHEHEHQRFLMEKLVIVTTPMVTVMRNM